MCFLGMSAPPPDGDENPNLRRRMLRAAISPWFRWKVRCWQRLTRRTRTAVTEQPAPPPDGTTIDISETVRDFSRTRTADWFGFLRRLLGSTEYRRPRGFWQAFSLGWAGRNPKAVKGIEWLFGATVLQLVPLIGGALLQHELLHAVQEFASGDRLFDLEREKKLRPLECWRLQVEAQLFGGPLIGVPTVFVLVVGPLAFFAGLCVLAFYLFVLLSYLF
jgi:hypothetical protein